LFRRPDLEGYFAAPVAFTGAAAASRSRPIVRERSIWHSLPEPGIGDSIVALNKPNSLGVLILFQTAGAG